MRGADVDLRDTRPQSLIQHPAHGLPAAAPDKQRALKEVFHEQICPAGQRLKRSFLSPSSEARPIEPVPGIFPLRPGYGPAPRTLGQATPTFSQDTCILPPTTPPSPICGNLPSPHRSTTEQKFSTLRAHCNGCVGQAVSSASESTHSLPRTPEPRTPSRDRNCSQRDSVGRSKNLGRAVIFGDRWLGKFPNSPKTSAADWQVGGSVGRDVTGKE
ncbi:hypothetical protein SKAU_G00227200 [Synaphobranchus kaupii]|uniref:Uncharacterized protein n=1 Tax=Synaphobranchus kaupii TaxID=118154 RepID=A0A9Q1F4X3_SYNKA|nr:hypothetical protein SKAU_G00227200 [Synaphobranchus kaupii]